jgi:hypothetical protein
MRKACLIATVMIVLSAEPMGAQYVRPVEVVPPRPVMPTPVPVTPVPNVIVPMPSPASPMITTPPIAIVPSSPPVAAQGGKSRPRRCWCYARNPANNTSQRTTCEVECCKRNDRDERC